MTTIEEDLCRDAIVVLPGIMGSELVETATGTVLWGMANPGWYARAWIHGGSLDRLVVTDHERSGRTGRIHSTRTLRMPAFAPLLGGLEPYTAMLSAATRFAIHADAVREFPYDWRLSIDCNANRLASAAEQHLATWRNHPKGSRDAKLILVAHSMGGLIARYFQCLLGGARDVRATVTLGTPYYGAVKSVVMMSSGYGGPIPLPRQRLRRLARTLPGLYDLLPSFRCVDEGASSRRICAADIAAVGGDSELAKEALGRREAIDDGNAVGLRALVGVQQPTMQSLRITDGVAVPLYYTCFDAPEGGLTRIDRRGDSTVSRDAAAPRGIQPAYLPQAHLALAKSEEGVAYACAVMTGTTLGPPLGDGGIGVEVPDVVETNQIFEIIARDVNDPAMVSCNVERIDEGGSHSVDRPYFVGRDSRNPPEDVSLAAQAKLRKPGMYRVNVK